MQSADANAGSAGTVVGTVTGIVPIDASTLYVGTVNGGVWKTTDGGTTWTPLTNNQASLSIASLGLDPTDPTHQTLVAGIGQTSNGAIGGFNGGLQYGLLYTQNGGTTWQTFNSFSGQSVIDALARGQTILAATYNPNDATSATGGLYRSVNGGTTFSPVTALPAVPVTSLVGDPLSMTTMYAVTTSPNKDPTQVGIYQSINDGANWKAVFTANTPVTGGTNIIATSSNQLIGTLATGPGGAIAVGFVDQTTKQPVALYLSQNQGQTWTALKLPNPPEGGGINPGNQALTDFAVAIDPHNTNIVYVAGDRQQGTGSDGSTFPNSIGATTYTLQAWRIQLNADNTSTATAITDNYAANHSTAHADSRAMAFDAAGDLLLSTDAGLYLRTQPQSSSGGWQGLNGNLSLFQTYSIAYDANSKRVIIAGQDTGAAIQGTPGAAANYTAVQAGDGAMAAVNDKWTGNRSAIYTSSQGLGGVGGQDPTAVEGIQRDIVDANGNNLGATTLTLQGLKSDDKDATGNLPFLSKFVINKVNPSLIAVGTNYVYTTSDPPLPVNATPPQKANLVVTPLPGTTKGQVNALVYGVPGANGVGRNVDALLAATANGLYLSTSAAGPLTRLTGYTGDLANTTSVVFDARTVDRLYVADTTNLYSGTSDPSAPFQSLTANLPAGFIRPTALEFIATNGVNALLVGGLNQPISCTSAPNGCVITSQQSPITVADSNASGQLSGWRAFGQGLPNVQIGQLAYNPTVDVLAVGTFGRGAWLIYDATSYFRQATALQFGLANNDSMPDASYLTDGTNLDSSFFARPLVKYGTGTLTINGTSTYTSTTTVNGGVLAVNGSIASSSGVAVYNNGTLAGSGAVPSTTINSGGTLAPGTATIPGTSMTVLGSLAFQSGAFYTVQINPTTASLTNVTGTASLNGDIQGMLAPGSYTKTSYTILHSGGLNGTAFTGFNAPGFAGTLTYTPTDAILQLVASLGGAGLNANQQSVANTINNFFNSGGTLPPNFMSIFSLTGSNLTNALAQLSGEAATAGQQATFQMMSSFLSLMIDPSVDGRIEGTASGFAPEQQAHLPPDIARAYASVLRLPPAAPSFDRRWSAWGSAFGGYNKTNGDPVAGTNNVTARAYGFAAGMDYHVTPDMLLGFALAGSGSNWGVAQNLGGGRSDSFQTGVYDTTHFGPAYLSVALAFANHWITTNRTAALGDQLTARFDGQSYGARLESGYRFATMPMLGVTPYAALQAQWFHTPGYSETDLTGGGFGLAYNAMAASDTRSELGTRLDDPTTLRGLPLMLRARAAWAHDWASTPSLTSTFQTLPGANFIVNGPAIPHNSALATASAELRLTDAWLLAAKFDAEIAAGSQTYAGTGSLRYTW